LRSKSTAIAWNIKVARKSYNEFHLLADDAAISHIERYDLLDRLVESYTEDVSGEISSRVVKSYDGQGNEIEQIRYGDSGKSVIAKR
jgi:hypothetical protein